MPPEKPHWAELLSEVVTSGLCTGCAGCVVACPYDVLSYHDTGGRYKPFHIAVPAGFSQIHHKERLPSPVVDVKHPRFGFLGYHHEQEGSFRVIKPLLELPLCPPRKSQDQRILIQPVQSKTLCVRAMHRSE